jgi:hypothetical protein
MKTPSSHFPIHTEKAPSPIPGPVLFPFFSTFFLRKKKVAKKNGYSCCRLSAGLQRPAPTDLPLQDCRLVHAKGTGIFLPVPLFYSLLA